MQLLIMSLIFPHIPQMAYLRLRNSPGILDHVPEAAVLSPLGLRSSWSHCTRLPVEPTEPRCPLS